MVCGTFTINSIPSSAAADAVVQRYKANVPPPTSVSKTQNADGTWTVTAVFPACSGNTAHSVAGS